jgi:endo-1,4-beta-xylanase
MGPEYIFRSFARAAATDPKAKLVLNEAWTERSDKLGLAVRKGLLKLIDQMQDRGLRLDVIGLQGHLNPAEPYDDASFVDFLHQIEVRGLSIYITEFDIDDRSFPTAFAARDQLVAERAYTFLSKALSVKSVRALICWGLSDRYTWWREPSIFEIYKMTRLSRPLPYDDSMRPKSMWDAIALALSERTA